MYFRILAAVTLILTSLAAYADTLTIGGNLGSNGAPFTDSVYVGEYQQAYSAAAFAGPVAITALTFFPAHFPELSSASITGNYTLRLSTTTKALYALSTTYAENLGPDNTIFAAGQVNDVLTFTGNAFFYNPAMGNLLLDVLVISPSPTRNVLVAGNSPYTARVRTSFPNFTAVDYTFGLLTQFTVTPYSAAAVTPEPSSLALLSTGLLSICGVARRRLHKNCHA